MPEGVPCDLSQVEVRPVVGLCLPRVVGSAENPFIDADTCIHRVICNITTWPNLPTHIPIQVKDQPAPRQNLRAC